MTWLQPLHAAVPTRPRIIALAALAAVLCSPVLANAQAASAGSIALSAAQDNARTLAPPSGDTAQATDEGLAAGAANETAMAVPAQASSGPRSEPSTYDKIWA